MSVVPGLAVLATAGGAIAAQRATAPSALVDAYCVDCHSSDKPKGNLNLEALESQAIGSHSEQWEKVIVRLRGRQMPPMGKKRPGEDVYSSTISQLEDALDAAARGHPNPGRTDTIRRLTRTEYQNAIRDLLALDIDVSTLLPGDDTAHGFDNVTVGNLSPTLLDRYVTAAEKISQLAVGSAQRVPGGDTIRIRPDITQEDHVEGLPLGTRGGALLHYNFSRNGEYEIQVRLTRDRNEFVEGLHEKHEMLVLVDGEQVQSFTVQPPPPGKDHQHVDDHLKCRITAKAGPHDLGITFTKNPSSLIETTRQPYNAHFNMHRHPRLTPAVYQISITGPYKDSGAGDTPSRRRIFASYPSTPDQEESCARTTLASVMRRAFRRPVSDEDVQRILPFYQEGRAQGDYDSGIESALSAILVSREFLFRVEQPPAGTPSGGVYHVSDLDLASRLSFFLWSSIPDDQLLSLAEKGELHQPQVLEAQTRRMLADARSRSLVTNFAAQWLHLRTLEAITPDGRLFPDFDDNLRQAFLRETQQLFDEVIHEDRSVLDLLKSDHTWVNERLAKHYGIPYVYGTRFRQVRLDPQSHRGGLLRQGSILTVTSYATRTSPVIRGKWIMENLLGTPPPPPPADVPALEDNTVSASLPMRQRLMQHRANPACASCHALMDPVGFCLENYDAVGQWRTLEEGQPVDCTGGMPDGSTFSGVDGLEAALLRHPDDFANTMAEKLLTYALGRGVEYYDGPAVREVVRSARANDYRFSSLIQAIVNSTPFQMRTSP
jgi:mono/diheme cytochrome c family protein